MPWKYDLIVFEMKTIILFQYFYHKRSRLSPILDIFIVQQI